MIVLDTHVLIFDALNPARLSPRARLVTSDARLRKLDDLNTVW